MTDQLMTERWKSNVLSLGSLVDNRDTGVMADPGQFVSRGREGDIVHPASTSIRELSHAESKRHLLAPASGFWFLLNLLHIAREHPVPGGNP